MSKKIQLNTIDLSGGIAKGRNRNAPDLSGYAKKEDVPTKVSELENDSGFVTKSEVGKGWRFVKDLVIFDDTLSSYELVLHSLLEDNYEHILIECDNGGGYNGGTPVYYDNVFFEPIGYDSIECTKKQLNGTKHWFVTSLGDSITAKNLNEEDIRIEHCSSKKAEIGLLGFKAINPQRNLVGTIKLYVK